MSDFEYFGTIGAFIFGFVLLIYLFRVRKILMQNARIQYNLAKAKIHRMTRPTPVNVWGNEDTRKRDIR